MPTKQTTSKASKRATRGPGRFGSGDSSRVGVSFRESSPVWETNLENNLVEEGLPRSTARKLVKLAAS